MFFGSITDSSLSHGFQDSIVFLFWFFYIALQDCSLILMTSRFPCQSSPSYVILNYLLAFVVVFLLYLSLYDFHWCFLFSALSLVLLYSPVRPCFFMASSIALVPDVSGLPDPSVCFPPFYLVEQ